MADLDAVRKAVEFGKKNDAIAATNKALLEGADPADLVAKSLIPAMAAVGEKFQKGEAFVPEMLVAAKAMKSCMEIIRPRLVGTGYQPVGKVVIGTVRGDLHDIGKNLVTMMLRGAGFEVVDLGVDVPPEKFVDSAKSSGVQLICLSALLTTTMPQMPKVIEALKAAGVKKVKDIIGGAPVTQKYADEIGADGYAADAASAVDIAKSVLNLD